MANSVFTGYISNGVNLAVTSYTSGQNPLSVGQVLYTNGISVGAGSNMSRIATSAGDGINYTLSNPDSFPSYYVNLPGNTTTTDGSFNLNPTGVLFGTTAGGATGAGWCIEFWLRINNVSLLPSTAATAVGFFNAANKRAGIFDYGAIYQGGLIFINAGYGNIGSIQKTWASNTWYHIALIAAKDNNTTVVCIDGKSMTAFDAVATTTQIGSQYGLMPLIQRASVGWTQFSDLSNQSGSGQTFQIFDLRVHSNPATLPYNHPALPNINFISGCTISNTAGGFTFIQAQNIGKAGAATTPLNVGMGVLLSGTFTLAGGTPGGITGYTGSGLYYIIATNGTSNFQLSATLGGAPVTTTISSGGTLSNPTFQISGQQIFTNPSTFLTPPANGQLYFSAQESNTFAFTTDYTGFSPTPTYTGTQPYKTKVNNAITGTLPFTPNTYSLTVNAIDVANSGTQNTVMNIPTRSRTILDKYTPLPKSITVYPLNRRSFAIPNILSSNTYNLNYTSSRNTVLRPYILNKDFILNLNTSKMSNNTINFSSSNTYNLQFASSRNTIFKPAITRADKTNYLSVKSSFAKSSLSSNAYNLMVTESSGTIFKPAFEPSDKTNYASNKKSFAKGSLSSNAYNLMVTESSSTALVPYVLNKNYILTLSTSKIGNNTLNFLSSNTYNLQYVTSRNTIFKPAITRADRTNYASNKKSFAKGSLSSNAYNLMVTESFDTIFKPAFEPSDKTNYTSNKKSFAKGSLSSNTFNYSSFASRNTTYLVFYPIMTRGLTGDKNISTGTSASQIWTTG